MGNRPDNLVAEQIDSEDFDFEGILDAFKKSLQPKEGELCVSYNEVQEALSTIIAHMQVVHFPYATFIRDVIGKYNKNIMNGDESEKTRFIGLQGYIRYIEERIVQPFENELQKPEFRKKHNELIATIRITRENITEGEIVIAEMKRVQKRIDTLLQTDITPQAQALLRKEKNNSTQLVSEIEENIEVSRTHLMTLTGKKN